MKQLVLGVALALLGLSPAVAVDERPAVEPELRELLKKAANESDSFADRFDGEVWLTDMSRRLEKRVPDHDFRIELLKSIHYEAKRARIEPELVLSVIQVESNFNPYAISRAGAIGLMQVMPFWLKEIGKPGDSLFSPHTNLRYGCTILRYYLDKEKGNRVRALMRYNGTRERRYPAQVYKVFDQRWQPQ
jgi:soluble lytic murein transglycosylase-like protein